MQKVNENILKSLYELMAKPYIENRTKALNTLKELESDIKNDFYTIVVLGEFKRGKSTLVNALLGKSILPMDVLPETATINAIMYEEKPRLAVINRDGTTKQGEVSYEFLKQYSAREKGEAEKVRYIKIGYPCELLKNKIALVDTPGVSDINEQRSEVTYHFVPKANAVIFVLDANSPLKKTEKEFIEQRLLPIGIDNILFIVNKYDAVEEDEEEEFLESVKKRLFHAFKMNTKEAKLRGIEVYPLSAKLALQGIEKNNKKLIDASGFNAVYKIIQDMLFEGKVAKEKERSNIKRFIWTLSLLEREIDAEIKMKNADISELKEAAKALREMMQDKTSEANNISGYITSAKTKIYAMTDKSIECFHRKLRENVVDLIEQHQSQNFKVFVEQNLTKQIGRYIEGWIGSYTPHVDELLLLMERELARGLSYHFKQQVRLQAAKSKKLENMATILNIEASDISGTGMKANAITAVGAVAIMVALNPLLVPILSIWGRSKIFENLLQKKLAEAKADVIPQVESQLAKLIMELRAHVHRYIDQKAMMIGANTKYAYESIISDIREGIEAQIAEKEEKGASTRMKILELMKNASEIKGYMAKFS